MACFHVDFLTEAKLKWEKNDENEPFQSKLIKSWKSRIVLFASNKRRQKITPEINQWMSGLTSEKLFRARWHILWDAIKLNCTWVVPFLSCMRTLLLNIKSRKKCRIIKFRYAIKHTLFARNLKQTGELQMRNKLPLSKSIRFIMKGVP